MTFKECVQRFPLYDTLIGNYSLEQRFSIKHISDVDDIEEWKDNPFWEDSSCYSFVSFNPTSIEFECFTFTFSRVSGYLNETDDPDKFYPATYSVDFGWEKIDFNHSNWIGDEIITPDDELAIRYGWPNSKDNKWRREQIAFLFNADSYANGLTFTTPDALKEFVRNYYN